MSTATSPCRGGDSNSIKQFSVDNKLFMLMSDITLRDKNATSCVLFNKTVATNYNLGDLYTLPVGDSWTWDKMIEISKGVSGDANGDGVLDENDNWGMMAKDDLVYVLFGGQRRPLRDQRCRRPAGAVLR